MKSLPLLAEFFPFLLMTLHSPPHGGIGEPVTGSGLIAVPNLNPANRDIGRL